MEKIATCIVLYNPDIKRLIKNINSIITQTSEIVLVDNNSENIDEINKVIGVFGENISIIQNKKNIGIAAALNIGMFHLKTKKYNWVLTLDQDSICPYNLISEYRKYMNKETDVGIVCPIVRDTNMNKDLDIVDNSKSYEFIEQAITSAALTNIDIWEKVGKFDEKLFIDMVDFDFCKRVRKHGYKIIRVNSVKLIHEIGNAFLKKIFAYQFKVLNHSKKRKYYRVRNIIYFNYIYRISMVKTVLTITKIYLEVVFWEKDKQQKIKNIHKGIKDGLIMIKGVER